MPRLKTLLGRWLPWLVKAGISAGLFAYLLGRIDLGAVSAAAGRLGAGSLALAFLLALAQVGLGAVRWWLVLRALRSRFGFGRSLRAYMIGTFCANLLPGAIGGDAVRIWAACRSGLSLGSSVNSVMLERGATVLGLVFLVTASQPLLLARLPDLPGAWVFPCLSALGVVGVGVLACLDRLPDGIRRWRLGRGLAALAADTRRVFFHPGWAGLTVITAVATQVNLSMVAYVIAQGIGLDVGMIDCLVLVPVVMLVVTLPVTIAGFGLRETAMVVGLGHLGVAAADAVALSLLFAAVTIAATLPGGLVWLFASKEMTTPPPPDRDGSGD